LGQGRLGARFLVCGWCSSLAFASCVGVLAMAAKDNVLQEGWAKNVTQSGGESVLAREEFLMING